MTEKTIADKLAIEPNTKVWLSDAVHLELDGSIATLVSYLIESRTPKCDLLTLRASLVWLSAFILRCVRDEWLAYPGMCSNPSP